MAQSAENVLYDGLAKQIIAGRKQSGLRQGELATAMGVSQQTVSRWEAGTSRPRPGQIPALARAIRTTEAQLYKVARYDRPLAPAAGSLDQPFPVDALSPDSFERLLDYILHALHPTADVRRAGKSGHDQGGVDILVVLRDGTRFSFQCKRVTRFGPADVDAAVQAHREAADRKHLVLSRVASPQTSAALRRHKDWELWDKEDIARIIRSLSQIDQIRLVDTFFPGQRASLLGIQPPGAWQTFEEFFAPFSGSIATFSHDWSLVGRSGEAEKITSELIAGPGRIALLVGAGGLGKSRLLKQIVENIRRLAPELDPLFLSPSEQLTAQALSQLGERPRVLIVDDAHDRGDLEALFAFAAAHDVRLLLAARPYATARLRQQAGVFARAGAIDVTELHRLSADASTALARQVLQELGGDIAFAPLVAQATRDCPLVTVMAARISVKENLPLSLAQNSAEFRDTILGKFADIVTGELAPPGDQKPFTDILKLVSLVQPFSIDDPEFRALAIAVTGLDEDSVAMTLRLLVEGGIIFRRGNLYRLMPDVLGDYVIERTCIDISDRLASFADKVFQAAPASLLGHVLVNLGRLDWRRTGGDPSKSHLLDHLWRALKVTGEHHDSALEAAAAAALYQPRQAIDFVTTQARRGTAPRRLTKILKQAAYNLDCLDEVCALLWELGRSDRRELSRHPDHALRILTQLCTVEPNKPLAFIEKVVAFGLKLLRDEDAFTGSATPYDFLEGILSGAGHTTEGDQRSVTFIPFSVNYDAVQPYRQKVITAALDQLRGAPIRAAVRAAAFLERALHYPLSTFNGRVPDETLDKYTIEFHQTLAALNKLVTTGATDPVILIAIAQAVAWHANYDSRGTKPRALALMRALPMTLEFRTLCALVDGFGRIFLGRPDANSWQERLARWIGALVADLNDAYPDPADLRRNLEASLTRIRQARLARDESTHILIDEILRSRTDFALELVETGLQSSKSPLLAYFGTALFFVLHDNPKLGRHWSRRFLDSATPEFQQAVGRAYGSPPLENGRLAEEDRIILMRILGSTEPSVVRSGLGALGALARQNPRLALDLLRHTNLTLDAGLVDDAFMQFFANHQDVLTMLEEDDVRFLLAQLTPLAELNGYWIESLLSHLSLHFPELTCAFFLKRTELAIADDASFSRMRPINYGPYVTVPLRFKTAANYASVLDSVWQWIRTQDANNWRFEYHAAALFEGMFLPIDADVVAFLSAKLAVADIKDLRCMATVLSHADANFAFEQQSLVVSFLDACERVGQPLRRKAIDALVRASISGVRSGRPGEPFPRDLHSIERVAAILPGLPRLSAAYELYDFIRDHAERGVEFQRQDAEFFEDD